MLVRVGFRMVPEPLSACPDWKSCEVQVWKVTVGPSNTACKADRQTFGNTIVCLTNKHMSLTLRSSCFDTVLSATVLFGLHTVPLTQSQLHDLYSYQRRMPMTFWVNTMSQINQRLKPA